MASRLTFSLSTLLLAAAIIGVGGGSVVRFWLISPVYRKAEVRLPTANVLFCTKIAGQESEIQYVVVIADGYSTHKSYRFRDQSSSVPLQADGLTAFETQLYANGEFIQPRPNHRCFVYGHSDQMIPLAIPEEELQKVDSKSIHELDGLRIWHEYIQPVIENERAAFETQAAARAEEHRHKGEPRH